MPCTIKSGWLWPPCQAAAVGLQPEPVDAIEWWLGCGPCERRASLGTVVRQVLLLLKAKVCRHRSATRHFLGHAEACATEPNRRLHMVPGTICIRTPALPHDRKRNAPRQQKKHLVNNEWCLSMLPPRTDGVHVFKQRTTRADATACARGQDQCSRSQTHFRTLPRACSTR